MAEAQHKSEEQEIGVEPIDLLLHEGNSEELRSFRERVAEEPMLAFDLADTVTLVERLRTVRTEPNAEFAGKLADVVRRAERRMELARPRQRAPWLLAAAVAVVSFLVAAWSDPLSLREREDTVTAEIETIEAVPAVIEPVLPTAAELAHSDALVAMRRRFEAENATQLSEALESAVLAERDVRRDQLSGWLNPRNALAVLHLDHELRGRVEVRLRALRSEGAMLAADQRAQSLADSIAARLSAGLSSADPDSIPHAELALALRALVAVGASTDARRAALGAGTARLAIRLPMLVGEELVQALAALVETAAVEGLPIRGLAAAGRGLVDEIMLADDETWTRRRPDLLTSRVSTTTLGDAGRTLALLPAFGCATDRCEFVRRLLLGKLRERRGGEQDQPEVLAAMLYGYADLLDSEQERDSLVRQLRRWKPVRLAPDFATVHQIAWGVEPGRSGFTRLQRDLRQLVILRAPEELGRRAALCMCLATNYAAHRRHSLERFARVE